MPSREAVVVVSCLEVVFQLKSLNRGADHAWWVMSFVPSAAPGTCLNGKQLEHQAQACPLSSRDANPVCLPLQLPLLEPQLVLPPPPPLRPNLSPPGRLFPACLHSLTWTHTVCAYINMYLIATRRFPLIPTQPCSHVIPPAPLSFRASRSARSYPESLSCLAEPSTSYRTDTNGNAREKPNTP